ncbi:MAG: ABC transporter ATP-binding protein, partial [Clostridia bacterium]|nr:ABC transporter ATP-binding protein [Clostridia bacterium]
YKKLWGMTRGLRLMMLFPLLASVISVAFRFILPFVQKTAINEYILNGDRADNYLLHFGVIIGAIIMLDRAHRAVNVLQGRIAAVSGNRFTRTLRAILFEKIQMLSMNSISAKTTGDLMGRINNDVNVVQNFMTHLLPTYFGQLFSFILALALLLWLNPLMCLFVFIPIPIAVFAIFKFRENMRRRNIHSWLLGQRTNHLLQDVINGARVVKAYGNEANAINDFEKHTEAQAVCDEDNGKVFDTVFPILGYVVRFGSYLILLYGNLLLFQGGMDVGTLNQFNSYANIIYEPLMQITAIPRNISAFMTSLSKIFEILEEEPDVADVQMPRNDRIKGDVEIKNVTFGYESYNPVLKNVSLSVKAGEMIGLVGHSGCGKTTLINLIMRLYEVNRGSIEIDGINIKDFSQNALRSQIGVVLQETHLFSGSVRDNIRYGNPHATNEEVVMAARAANAHDFIINLPEGYNTMVGEKGFSLSGGERQRIAIARALIHNPKILILDEATAALDTETEKLIQDALNKLAVGRTTFAIAHRLSTLRNADKILVLDHGNVVEFGTHLELLNSRGHYYKLVMAQKKAAESGVEAED